MLMSIASDLIPANRLRSGRARIARRERWHTRVNQSASFLELVGFGWLVPLFRMALGEDIREQGVELWRQLGVPLLAIVLFLGALGVARAQGTDEPRRAAGAGSGLAAGGESLGRSCRRARQGARIP